MSKLCYTPYSLLLSLTLEPLTPYSLLLSLTLEPLSLTLEPLLSLTLEPLEPSQV